MDEVKPAAETNNAHQTHKADKSEQEIHNFKKAIESEIHELEERYAFLTQEVKDLEESKTTMKENMKTVQNSFEQVNQNISEIMKKLDTLTGECENIRHMDSDEYLHEREPIGNIIRKPLRKLAVGTFSFLYSIADVTLEGASNIKEGFEDIVAEAQYENKKRRMRPAE